MQTTSATDVEAYFDESQSDNHFCLAGYVFERNQRAVFVEKWTSVLRQYDVPFFHMKDAGNPKGFLHLTPLETDELYRALLELIKNHSAGGYAVTFDLRNSHLLPRATLHGVSRITPYALCSYFCFQNVRHWVDANRYAGKVRFIFEDGHISRTEADRIMRDMFEVPRLATHFRYGGHEFSTKLRSPALQAADVLAWHWRKNVVDRSKGRAKPRADLLSLIEQRDKIWAIELDAKNMLDLLDVIARSQNPNLMTFKITYKVGTETTI